MHLTRFNILITQTPGRLISLVKGQRVIANAILQREIQNIFMLRSEYQLFLLTFSYEALISTKKYRKEVISRVEEIKQTSYADKTGKTTLGFTGLWDQL